MADAKVECFSFDRARIIRRACFHIGGLAFLVWACLGLADHAVLHPTSYGQAHAVWLVLGVATAGLMALRVYRYLPLVYASWRTPMLAITKVSNLLVARPRLGPDVPATLVNDVTYSPYDRVTGRPESVVFSLTDGTERRWRCDAIKDAGEVVASRMKEFAQG